MTNEFSPEVYQSPRNLAMYAIIGFAVLIVTDFVSVFLGFGQIATPDWSIDLEGDAGSVWLLLQGVVSLLQIPAFIFTVVMFLIWLNRANKNLTPLKAGLIEYSSGWAVGWWFIPFANLVKPFQVVREVWCESDPEDVEAPGFLSASIRSAPTHMGVWWAFWLVSNFLSNATGRVFDPEDTGNVALVGVLFIATAIASAIAAVLAIKIVRDITARQDARILKVGNIEREMQPPPPPTFGYEQQ